MNQILLKIIKTLAYIFVFTTISFTVVYLLNKSSLDLAQSEVKVVTADNYASVKDSIAENSVIQITGTPDLLKQVSEEAKDSISTEGIQFYYTALKEYGDNIVVKVKPGKLNPLSQTFTGQAVNLSRYTQGEKIISGLNAQINLDSSLNADAAKEIQDASKSIVEEDSKGNFGDSTLLILDEDVPNLRQVTLGIALWTSVLSLFLITLFRKKVFQMK